MGLSGKTKVVGVFGDPVEHSLSPSMHNAAFAALDLDWVYVPFHVKPEALCDAVRGVAALGMAGVNVTVPHKVRVMEHLDEIDDEARLIGAVNTIVNRSGRLVGYNTDGRGFLRSLKRQGGAEPKGARVVILGAGGAAQAIACSLALHGAARVTVANRTRSKAEALADRISAHTSAEGVSLEAKELAPKLAEADILVHTTSLGMYPHHDVPPAVPPELLSPTTLVCDIVYTPRETSLIAAARSRGCRVVTGEGMLAYQGAIAFELWTGREAPEKVMLERLRAHLAARDGDR